MHSFDHTDISLTRISAKSAWEDPSLTLERDLIVRAQGGGGGPEEPWEPRYSLAPLGNSQNFGQCIPPQ